MRRQKIISPAFDLFIENRFILTAVFDANRIAVKRGSGGTGKNRECRRYFSVTLL